MTSSDGEDSSELDAYIAGGANLFGLLSATVTGSLKLQDTDKELSPDYAISQVYFCNLRRKRTRPSSC